MKPTVIFIHGIGLSGAVWAPQERWCREHGIECIVLTLPGHGERRDEAASISGMVDDVISAAEHLKNVVLVGHSFGAYVAALASKKLSNVSSLILINPLLNATQLRTAFIWALSIGTFVQRLIGVRNGACRFSDGTFFFWRFGIYAYCLLCNRLETIGRICAEIKELGRQTLPSHVPSAVLFSRRDEFLKRSADVRGNVVPVSGHMLFRIAPDAVEPVLAEIASA